MGSIKLRQPRADLRRCARNGIATVEIERMNCDPNWLDKAVLIVEKQIQEMNRKPRYREPKQEPALRT